MRRRSPAQRRKKSERPKAFALLFCRDTVSHTKLAPPRRASPFQAAQGLRHRRREGQLAAPNDSLLPRQAGRLAASPGAASTRFSHQPFSAGIPSLALGQRRLVGPPFLGGIEPSSSPQRGAIGCPKRYPLAPADGTTYCFGGRGLNSVLAPAVLCRDAIPRTGAAPTRGASPFQAAQGLRHRRREGQLAAPNDSLSPRQAGRPTVSVGAASTRLPHRPVEVG